MKTKLNNLYLSLDVESDGPTPGRNNLLSVGLVTFWDGQLQSRHSWNLDLLPPCKPDPKTMESFWNKDAKHKALYDLTRVSPIPHTRFVNELYRVVKGAEQASGDRAVFVAAPSIYDYKWIDYEMNVFYGENPFGHSQCIDIRNYVFAREQAPFYKTGKRTFPKHWFPAMKHSHVAVEDAEEQGELFMNILRHYDAIDNPVAP